DLNGTTLTFSGVAKKSWIKKIMQITPVLTGITHVNIDKLKNYDQSITQHLQPPTTTNFSYEDGRLQLNGVAPLRWHQQATKKIAALKFVNQVQWSTLEITEAIKLQQLKERVEKQAIYFTKSVAITVKADVLQTLIDEINEMLTLSQQLNKTMILTITGYTDGVDSTEYNTALATTRAQKMVELLKKSLPLVNMKTAVQLSSTKRSNQLQRKVSFMISFNKESSIK
ncbi:MAG: OmpA family protein, partial [Methylococcales bacterium]|nr:OmpA family protein [Methylococcales bacterium]